MEGFFQAAYISSLLSEKSYWELPKDGLIML